MTEYRVCRVCVRDPARTYCRWVERDLCSDCGGRPAALRDALEELAAEAARLVEICELGNAIAEDCRAGGALDHEKLDVLLAAELPALARLRVAVMHAQQLLDATRCATEVKP